MSSLNCLSLKQHFHSNRNRRAVSRNCSKIGHDFADFTAAFNVVNFGTCSFTGRNLCTISTMVEKNTVPPVY